MNVKGTVVRESRWVLQHRYISIETREFSLPIEFSKINVHDDNLPNTVHKVRPVPTEISVS